MMSAQNEPETVVQTEVSEQNAETSAQLQETADDGVQKAQEAPQNVASSLETQATAAKEQEDAQAAKEAGNMVDLDNDPTKLIEIVEIGKQLLMTRPDKRNEHSRVTVIFPATHNTTEVP